jgi:alpha-L-fucosidase
MAYNRTLVNYYLDFMARQIEELLTQYGPIAAIWLDGIGVPLHPRDAEGREREDYDPRNEPDPFRCQELYDFIHSLQPQVLVSYKQGYLGTEDFFAPEMRAYNRFNQPFTE